MIDKANDEAEKNILKTNKEFHELMESRKRNAEERVRQMKEQAVKDIKNTSVKIAVQSVGQLFKNSIDKSKLDKLFTESIEETKIALKKKSS
jgi:F-type H+-transporting ATPase subunit b